MAKDHEEELADLLRQYQLPIQMFTSLFQALNRVSERLPAAGKDAGDTSGNPPLPVPPPIQAATTGAAPVGIIPESMPLEVAGLSPLPSSPAPSPPVAPIPPPLAPPASTPPQLDQLLQPFDVKQLKSLPGDNLRLEDFAQQPPPPPAAILAAAAGMLPPPEPDIIARPPAVVPAPPPPDAPPVPAMRAIDPLPELPAPFRQERDAAAPIRQGDGAAAAQQFTKRVDDELPPINSPSFTSTPPISPPESVHFTAPDEPGSDQRITTTTEEREDDYRYAAYEALSADESLHNTIISILLAHRDLLNHHRARLNQMRADERKPWGYA